MSPFELVMVEPVKEQLFFELQLIAKLSHQLHFLLPLLFFLTLDPVWLLQELFYWLKASVRFLQSARGTKLVKCFYFLSGSLVNLSLGAVSIFVGLEIFEIALLQ